MLQLTTAAEPICHEAVVASLCSEMRPWASDVTWTRVHQGRKMTTCQCQSLPILADVPMGQHDAVFDTLEDEMRHGEPLWWLSALRCRMCGQWWLVAADERINDVFLMRRLTEAEIEGLQRQSEWPADFSKFAEVLRLGRDLGHRSIFLDPESPALVYTVEDLAREEDGISVSRIASLLQIDLHHAQRLADLAEAQAPGRITPS
jgi:hypothetical protein